MYIILFYCNAISLSNNYRGTIIYVGCWQHHNYFPVTLFNQVDTREIVQKLFNSFCIIFIAYYKYQFSYKNQGMEATDSLLMYRDPKRAASRKNYSSHIV